MNFKEEIQPHVYGDKEFRGTCPHETVEQITFFRWLKQNHPELGEIAVHIRNEGSRTHGQAFWQKAEGLNQGASDVLIPTNPPIVLELKRQDHTKSRWQKGQQEYLLNCKKQGAFIGVCLGNKGAKEAIECYLNIFAKTTENL